MVAKFAVRTEGCKTTIKELGEEWPNTYVVNLPDESKWMQLGGLCLVNPKYVEAFKQENRV